MRFYKFFIFAVFAFALSFSFTSCKKETEPNNLEQYVTLDRELATLIVGEELTLTPRFHSDAVRHDYHWSTDNPQVIDISINEDYSATFTAKKVGSAKVALSSTNGTVSVVCEIVVENPPIDDDGVVRILAIGNSFSQDALETYLYELADAAELKVVIGNLYIGGASLDLHWQNANQNLAAYSYRKIGLDGNKVTKENTSIATAIADDEWDYISFQQASPNSGQYNTFISPLPLLFNYVKEKAINPSAKYILHQTWAYAQNSTHTGFANYGNSQMTMYNAIVDAVSRAKNLVDIDLIIPAGTAIQNGRSSIIGDNFNRDGYHLDINIGRYTAACTWFEAIFGENVIGNTFKPATISDYEAEIAQHAAHFAVLKPNEVNEMADYQEGEDYGPLTNPMFIGFGYDAVTAGWNGFLGASSYTEGNSIINLKDKNNNFTGMSITIAEGFNGRNANGEKSTTTDFNIPENISSYSYYGNSKKIFSGVVIEKSVLVLSGLDKDQKYDFCFFASRSAVPIGENRETKYILNGKNEVIARLDASNNTSETACGNGVQPDDNGEITLTITSGENNTNTTGFFYINAMRISPSN